MRTLTSDEVEDLIFGAEILGCGGGGSVELALDILKQAEERGLNLKIALLDEIKEDSLVFIVSRVGGGVEEDIKKRVERYPMKIERPELEAVKELAKFLGKKPEAILASEIGAGNMLLPLFVAASLDMVTIDGDACGRAKPEIAISTTHVKGIPIAPLAAVTPFGDVAIIKTVLNDYTAEDISRQIAVASGGTCGVARCPATPRQLKGGIVEGTISRCIEIGRRIKEALKSGEDPIKAFVETTEGKEIFRGVVRSWNREERRAFMWGSIDIEGKGGYEGHKLKIFFKNEFLISWLDGKPYVTCPDLICVIDIETGRGMSNWGDLRKNLGKDVAVVGVPAADIWRCERGIEIFGPKHFGFDIEYVPLEKRLT
ncbi:MAG TPA: DUF917 domain-containing protein [Candidatus Korarchaeota archaeon]|nr:DUF917 domain-containing protein [Candidatus Korarchaeota archaeon]